MTDRQTGKKYSSNRVCSRSFTAGTVRGNAAQQRASGKEKWIEIQGWDWEVEPRAGRISSIAADPADPIQPGKARITVGPTTPAVTQPPSVTQKSAGGRSAEESNSSPKIKPAQPDLIIKQFLFPPTNDKALRVQVANQGNAASGACRLILTVRKINGTAVGRQTHVNIPALAPGKTVWLVIDAKSILPVNVSLKSTTFKLNADATGIVAESDETNNEVWHNL
jgi:hypothetical protein